MMKRYSFRKGQGLSLDGIAYRISQVSGRNVELMSLGDGSLSLRNVDDLLSQYAIGCLIFVETTQLEDQQAQVEQRTAVDRGLADFPDKMQSLALRKFKFLREICPDGRMSVPRALLSDRLRSVWEKLDPHIRGQKPPCPASFYGWRRSWVWADFDIRALIDKWELRGRKTSLLPDKISELIDEGIERVYLTPQRESLSEVRDWIQHEIEKENRRRAPEDALPRVTHRMLRRALSQIDRYAILKARYGERYAQEATRIYRKGPTCTRPLERVEVDHTPLDILVTDSSTGLLLGRPWITVMIDAYSRMIVGIHISFRKPGVRSVLRCLKRAILPKTYVKDRFPKVRGEWDAYGLIDQLVCDNGLEFHAQDLEAACAELGIHVIYCPTRAPQMKGRIERVLKTLNYGLVHLQPGTTFAKYDKRHTYDPERTAVLTLEALEEIVHCWNIDIYSTTFHRGIQTTPKQKWDEGVAKYPRRLPPSIDVANVYLGNSVTRTLGKNGIGAHGLQYASSALQDLRRRCGDVEVTVRTDPDNLGAIFVFDEEAKQYIEAKCTLAGYADGLTAEQHRWIESKAKKDYATSPRHFALLAAKSELRDYTARLIRECYPTKKRPKSGKATKGDREALIQREEARQGQLQLEPEVELESLSDPQETNWDDQTDIPLFPVRRGTI
jgi:putative transposase